MMSCSSKEAKIDAKKDATDMAKSIVNIIDKAEVNDTIALNNLTLKVDSMENTFYQFYGENKKDENGASLLDSLQYYYNETGKVKVDSALNAKRATLQNAAAPAPQEEAKPEAGK